MEKTRAEIAIDGLADYANNFNPNSDKLLAEFFRVEHRTLQQSMLRTMLVIIETIADDSYRTDGRNEQAKAICKKILAGFDTQVPENQKGFKPSEWLSYI